MATWLVEQGIAAGDKVAIVGSTRPAWCVSDLGAQLAGAITVGAYPTLPADQLAYILRHSDAAVAFVEGAAELGKLRQIEGELPALRHIVAWDRQEAADLDGLPAPCTAWADVLNTAGDDAVVRGRVDAIDPSACAIIVYTSGTTGPPKGAMLSHANILSVLAATLAIPFDADDEILSFLPMAHVAERIAGFYARIDNGTAAAYASSIPAVLEEVKEVRPTLFGSVPRIFEKAYARIQAEVDKAPRMRRLVFRWAESVGVGAVQRWQGRQPQPLRQRLQHALADRLVFSRIREAFGGRVRFFVTGAAPIPLRILEFFWAAGFPIFEAYGMTEATVITHANRPGRVRLGSVGQKLDFVEHRLGDDGEILIRGPSVFLGYHKDDAATREAVDDEGWLHTGDIGRIDEDGFLYIVDRKKHIIITAGGKNLTPANIEAAIKTEDPILSQVHAHGDRRPYVTALVTLSPIDAIDWALEHGGSIDAQTAASLRTALIADPLARPPGLDALLGEVAARAEVRTRVREAVRRGNRKLARVEQVGRVLLLERELSVAEDEITPTLKAKRKTIERKFAERFDRLYADPAAGIVIDSR